MKSLHATHANWPNLAWLDTGPALGLALFLATGSPAYSSRATATIAVRWEQLATDAAAWLWINYYCCQRCADECVRSYECPTHGGNTQPQTKEGKRTELVGFVLVQFPVKIFQNAITVGVGETIIPTQQHHIYNDQNQSSQRIFLLFYFKFFFSCYSITT